jgi:mannan endo-1,4-beta-mannosidase
MLPRTFTTLLIISLMHTLAAQQFVTVERGQFRLGRQPLYFLGTNFWYGMNLASAGKGGDRERLLWELDQLHALSVNNLRIMAASEGPDTAPWRMLPTLQTAPGQYNEDLLDGLDFLLAEMGKRHMHAVLCLNNLWPWSGGMAQYVAWATGEKIPYPPPAGGGKWLTYLRFSSRFFENEKAMEASFHHIRFLLSRRNKYTGLPYIEDPTIMAWQLANEPRGVPGQRTYLQWVRRTAALIKSLDPNHLVSIGSEGNAFLPLSRKFGREHRCPGIDYATMHLWVQNWGWYDPEKPDVHFEKALHKARRYIRRHVRKAGRLGMPVVLEEFGLARDGGSYDPAATTVRRDRYYREIFSLLHELAAEGSPAAGCNFWAWSGSGRPRQPRAIWKPGDDFTGDPPFEYQGWYSVYGDDVSTLAVVWEFAEKMRQLQGGGH